MGAAAGVVGSAWAPARPGALAVRPPGSRFRGCRAHRTRAIEAGGLQGLNAAGLN